MGLFDDIFRKDEINKLKKSLTEKTDDVINLKSEIVQLSSHRITIGEELVKLKKIVLDQESSISFLTNT
jgi:predicted  nucleic acid-binding Zn-ribbon protein